MDLTLLSRGGIALLLGLLALFELRSASSPGAGGGLYEYYTAQGRRLELRRVFGSHYRVYDPDFNPAAYRSDRYGPYFPLRASSPQDAEAQAEALYEGGDLP